MVVSTPLFHLHLLFIIIIVLILESCFCLRRVMRSPSSGGVDALFTLVRGCNNTSFCTSAWRLAAALSSPHHHTHHCILFLLLAQNRVRRPPCGGVDALFTALGGRHHNTRLCTSTWTTQHPLYNLPCISQSMESFLHALYYLCRSASPWTCHGCARCKHRQRHVQTGGEDGCCWTLAH